MPKMIKIVKDSNCIDRILYNSLRILKHIGFVYIRDFYKVLYTILKKTGPGDIDEITVCNESVNTS